MVPSRSQKTSSQLKHNPDKTLRVLLVNGDPKVRGEVNKVVLDQPIALTCAANLDDARSVLARIPEDTEDRERPQNRLEFIEEANGFESVDSLMSQLQATPDDLELKYQLSVQYLVSGNVEEGLEAAMDILRTDREFRDDIGRVTMIRAFAILGKGHELASKYRRKMFNFMH